MSDWINSLRATAEKATKGPWEHSVIYAALRFFRKCGNDVSDMEGYTPSWRYPDGEADAAHIARWDPATALLVVEVLEAADALHQRAIVAASPISLNDTRLFKLEDALVTLRHHIDGGGTDV